VSDNNNSAHNFSVPLFLRQVSDRSCTAHCRGGWSVPDEEEEEEGGEEEREEQQEELLSQLKVLGLLPPLRPYQLHAILWMMRREGRGGHGDLSSAHGTAAGGGADRVTTDAQGFVRLPSSSHRRNYSANNAFHHRHWVADSNCEADLLGGEESVAGISLEDILRNGGGGHSHRHENNVWFNVLTGKGVVFSEEEEEEEKASESSSSSRASSKSSEARQSDYLSKCCSALVSGGMLCDEPGLGYVDV
jgi:hypothetical protein